MPTPLQDDGAKRQNEPPEIRREHVRIVDSSPPERYLTLAMHVSPNIGVGDELKVREALTFVLRTRKSAAGADIVEQHLGGVLVVRARSFPSCDSVELVSIAATAKETAVYHSCGSLDTRVTHVFSIPAERDSARRVDAAIFDPSLLATRP